jgi:AbrB family looped-hinge helix DNA binding protein
MTFHARITSKGQITLPVELRSRLGLEEGDSVEFFFDHMGRVSMRARRAGVEALLDALPPRSPDPAYSTDDDAIAAGVLDRDAASRTRKGRNR